MPAQPCAAFARVLEVQLTEIKARGIGSEGTDTGQLERRPFGVAIDGDGRIMVCDSDNNHVQVLL